MRRWMETTVAGHSGMASEEPLAPRERIRLAGILSRLSSPYETERATAGLLASAFIAKHDMAWADLTLFLHAFPKPSVTSGSPRSQQDRRHGGRKDWRGYCRRRRMTSGYVLDLVT